MRKGIVFAALSYAAWGLFPGYFRLLHDVSSVEILAHRVIWSLVFLAIVLAVRRQWSWLSAIRGQPRVLRYFALSAILLSGNWLLYIWSVNNGHVIDASLGYFINPLVNILLGYFLLSERLRRVQWVAVGIAALGVLWLTYASHHFPWIGITLALTFGSYGLMRKLAALGPLEGLSLEALILFPVAIIYLLALAASDHSAFVNAGITQKLLMAAAGPITAVPLLLFAAGARRIPFSTLGLMQYIAPTLQLTLGIWLFDEPFAGGRVVGFAIIWVALGLFAVEGVWKAGRDA